MRNFSAALIAAFYFLFQCSAHASVAPISEWVGLTSSDVEEGVRRNYLARGELLHSPQDAGFQTTLQRIVNFPNPRVSTLFSIPEELRVPVTFWLRTFTQWHSKQLILVDEFHLDWVYAIIDLSSLPYGKAKKTLDQTLSDVRRAMIQLSRSRSEKMLAPLEKKIWETWGKPRLPVALVHRHRVTQLSHQIKVQHGARDALIRALALSEPYLPEMDEIFERQGLPKELTRLSLLESAFQFDAESKVGARGLWQFMERTAKDYLYLSEKNKLDERLSPWKSTVAATLLLKSNSVRLGNWFSAITAYNHGYRGLAKNTTATSAIQKLVSSACHGKSPLGWASRNYYAEYLAVLHAESFHFELFGEKPPRSVRPLRYVSLQRSSRARDLAMDLSLSLQDFLQINPDVQSAQAILPRGFLVAVPNQVNDFSALFGRELPGKLLPKTWATRTRINTVRR